MNPGQILVLIITVLFIASIVWIVVNEMKKRREYKANKKKPSKRKK